MVSVEKLYKFAKENLRFGDWEIDSPLMRPYLAFYLFNGQLFTAQDTDGNILGIAVLARSYYPEDFLKGIGRGWYYIDDFKYGDLGCIDLVCIKTGLGRKKGMAVSRALVRMIMDYADREGMVMGFSARLKDNTFVRIYYKKGVDNGKSLWVCRTIRVLEGQEGVIHLIEDILSTVERCRLQKRKGIQSNI